MLSRLWEALSPDPCLGLSERDYKWLTQVYESVKPPSGHGELLWYALGAKTIDLVHENVHLARLRKHNPKFTALGERLERFKERREQGPAP